MIEQEKIGNRKYRRTLEALKRSPKKTPKYLTADWIEKKKLIVEKVKNRIARVKLRKEKRLT